MKASLTSLCTNARCAQCFLHAETCQCLQNFCKVCLQIQATIVPDMLNCYAVCFEWHGKATGLCCTQDLRRSLRTTRQLSCACCPVQQLRGVLGSAHHATSCSPQGYSTL